MDRDQYTNDNYSQPHVPPATPPAIDPNVAPLDAAELARDNGDSDASGTREASVDRGDEDAGISPADTPDEIVPDEGDLTDPSAPDEVSPGQSPAEVEPQPGDTDAPGQIPGETLLPPD